MLYTDLTSCNKEFLRFHYHYKGATIENLGDDIAEGFNKIIEEG